MEELWKAYDDVSSAFAVIDQQLLVICQMFCSILCDSELLRGVQKILNAFKITSSPFPCNEECPYTLKDEFLNLIIFIGICVLVLTIMFIIVLTICFYISVQQIGFRKSLAVFLICGLLLSIILSVSLCTLGVMIYYIFYGLKLFLENTANGFGSIFDFTVRRLSTYHCYHEGGCFI